LAYHLINIQKVNNLVEVYAIADVTVSKRATRKSLDKCVRPFDKVCFIHVGAGSGPCIIPLPQNNVKSPCPSRTACVLCAPPASFYYYFIHYSTKNMMITLLYKASSHRFACHENAAHTQKDP